MLLRPSPKVRIDPEQERQLVVTRLPALLWQCVAAAVLAVLSSAWLTGGAVLPLLLCGLWLLPCGLVLWSVYQQARLGLGAARSLPTLARLWGAYMGLLQSLTMLALLAWVALTAWTLWQQSGPQLRPSLPQIITLLALLTLALSGCGFWQASKTALQAFAHNHTGRRQLLRPQVERLRQWGLGLWLLLGFLGAGLWWLLAATPSVQLQWWTALISYSPTDFGISVRSGALWGLLGLWLAWLWGVLVVVHIGHLLAGYLDLGTAGDEP